MKKLLPLLGLLWAAVSAAAPVLVQHTYVDGYYTSTAPTIALTGVAAGDALVLQIAIEGSGQTITVSDSNGAPSSCVPLVNPGSGWNGAVYDVSNTSSGTHTITVTPTVGGGQAYTIALAEYSGLATSSPCDQGGTTTFGNSNGPQSSSIMPSANGDLIVSLVAQAGAGDGVSSWLSGFTAQDSKNTNITSAWAQLVQATAAAVSTGAEINNSASWGETIASFKAAAGGSPPPSRFFLGASLLPTSVDLASFAH